jgi:sugar phosphate isomerase/epimerase
MEVSMKNSFHRRDFLKTSAAGFAFAGAAPGTPAKTLPRLLPGCCAYSYGSYLKDDRMTMQDFIVKAVELGVLGVELTAYWLKSTEPAYLAGLRTLGHKQGMPFSGVAIGTQMCQPDGAKRREATESITKWVDATDMLGASHLRVFGDVLPPGATVAQGIDWVVEVMKPACDYAGRKGIILGMETHMGLTVKAANVLEILHRVDSPYAGCTLDISNWKSEPYEDIAACLPYASNAHIRDYWGEAKNPLDLDRVFGMFAKAGYKGYMSVEYEGAEDPMTGVPKLVEKVKRLSRKFSSA